jgi:hypothetical protein
MIKFNINITSSKLLAYIIIIISFIYSIITKDSTVLVTSIIAAGGLHGVKTYTEKRGIIDQKNNNYIYDRDV